MSTRNCIAMKTKDGNYKWIYCHWNGSLVEGNGKMLLDEYQNEEKVEKLISLGDLSILGKYIEPSGTREHTFENPEIGVCVFYGRDRGETGVEAKSGDWNQLQEWYCNSWCQYLYVYQDGNWYVDHNGNGCELLVDAIKREQEEELYGSMLQY